MTKGENPRSGGGSPVAKIKVIICLIFFFLAWLTAVTRHYDTSGVPVFRVRDGADCAQECLFNPDVTLDTSQVRMR